MFKKVYVEDLKDLMKEGEGIQKLILLLQRNTHRPSGYK
jgi:hypothetical protein